MEEMIKTLPKHTSSWMKGWLNPMYMYQDFWLNQGFLEGAILAQQTFKAEPSDVFLCSYPKSGNTWLKALAFAIVTRAKFDKSTSPLLKNTPHKCVLFLEKELKQIQENRNNSHFPPVATHLPYPSLPDSIIASNCKIVYVYRNVKDVIVSYYHFLIKAMKASTEDVPFEEAFNEFYQGLSTYGPYWNHVLGFWKASLERPELIFFFKYEDMKTDPTSSLKRLAEFIGYPFSTEEVEAGVVDNIIELCSFENLRNLEANKIGMRFPDLIEVQSYFRKAVVGDWKNYFTDEMKEKIDKLIEEKLSSTGLVLK